MTEKPKGDRHFNFPRRQQRQVVTGNGNGGIELAHGVILEQCNFGCSTYRVQRVHRYLKTTCDDESGGDS